MADLGLVYNMAIRPYHLAIWETINIFSFMYSFGIYRVSKVGITLLYVYDDIT